MNIFIDYILLLPICCQDLLLQEYNVWKGPVSTSQKSGPIHMLLVLFICHFPITAIQTYAPRNLLHIIVSLLWAIHQEFGEQSVPMAVSFTHSVHWFGIAVWGSGLPCHYVCVPVSALTTIRLSSNVFNVLNAFKYCSQILRFCLLRHTYTVKLLQ